MDSGVQKKHSRLDARLLEGKEAREKTTLLLRRAASPTGQLVGPEDLLLAHVWSHLRTLTKTPLVMHFSGDMPCFLQQPPCGVRWPP